MISGSNEESLLRQGKTFLSIYNGYKEVRKLPFFPSAKYPAFQSLKLRKAHVVVKKERFTHVAWGATVKTD